MITRELATAQILFLLVSDSRPQLQDLKRDLQRSRYRYCLMTHADKRTLMDSITRQIVSNSGRLPVVLLIDYRFAGKQSQALLELARRSQRFCAIECIVTHPPSAQSNRRAFHALGATLFDGQDDATFGELVFH